MPIKANAADTRTARDLQHYRSKIDHVPHANEEVKATLTRRDPTTYNNPTDGDVKAFSAYRDFMSHRHNSNPPLPNRLGGGLEDPRPGYLANVPAPTTIQGKQTIIKWTPPGPGSKEITITVRSDGAIIHTNPDGSEDDSVHPYMHAIFDIILYDTRDKLEAINQALEAYAADFSPTTSKAQAYRDAVKAFEDFRLALNLGDSPYSGALNFADIYPVVTNEGFIVSARVKLNWKNPYHSSSTIKIP